MAKIKIRQSSNLRVWSRILRLSVCRMLDTHSPSLCQSQNSEEFVLPALTLSDLIEMLGSLLDGRGALHDFCQRAFVAFSTDGQFLFLFFLLQIFYDHPNIYSRL
jgi:hypothetical protein